MESVLEIAGVGEARASDELVAGGFADEVFSLEGRSGLAVVEDGSLAGFLEDGSPRVVFGRFADELEARGWTEVGDGESARSTFVKEQGAYRWLFLSCSQTGDRTSVVVQVK